jgi:DNA polymerase-3 subunit gamma/tau
MQSGWGAKRRPGGKQAIEHCKLSAETMQQVTSGTPLPNPSCSPSRGAPSRLYRAAAARRSGADTLRRRCAASSTSAACSKRPTAAGGGGCGAAASVCASAPAAASAAGSVADNPAPAAAAAAAPPISRAAAATSACTAPATSSSPCPLSFSSSPAAGSKCLGQGGGRRAVRNPAQRQEGTWRKDEPAALFREAGSSCVTATGHTPRKGGSSSHGASRNL